MTKAGPPSPRPLAPALKDFLRSVRFRPAIFPALREYTLAQFQRDALAGLVVGIVALPLAIAFAIASGAGPQEGLVTAALAGVLVAIFGGSRIQIAGPTGAFVVILYGINQEFGFEKLLLATLMAGALLFLMGLFRLGMLIKFIPYPVTTGFTAGIAVIIFLGQLHHILGLRLNEDDVMVPGDAVGIVQTVAGHLDQVDPRAVGLAAATILIIAVAKRFMPRVPGPFLALVLLATAASVFGFLHAQTVGELFPGLEATRGLPGLDFPALTWSTMVELFPAAFTIAMLGAIESLLSAVVADGMADTRHDSNQELMGQGIANLVVPLFGGIAATGAIARTATNVQNGGRTPVAALIHGLVVLLVLLVAAPLAALVPMAVLGGILTVVAWNMSERHRFAKLLKMPASDAGVMLATFAITVLVDLTMAVTVGMVLAAALFIGRMSGMARINVSNPEEDMVRKQESLEGKDIPTAVTVYSIDGPFFFGAAERFQEIHGEIGKEPRIVIFRMRRVPYLDATGLNALMTAVMQLKRHGSTVILSAPQSQPLEMMMRSGFMRQLGDRNVQPNIESALQRAREHLGLAPAGTGGQPAASSPP